MAVKISNSQDGTKGISFLSGKEYITSQGVQFTLKDAGISKDEALKYDLELSNDFRVPSNFNTKVLISQYLQTIGISRMHKSYIKLYGLLSEDLPRGDEAMRGKNKNGNDPR